MSALDIQRRETYAIRELWKSMQQRRSRNSRESHRSQIVTRSAPHQSLNSNNRHNHRVFRTTYGGGPYLEGDRPGLPPRANTEYQLTDRDPYLTTHDISYNNGSVSARSYRPRRLDEEDIPIHTAITMPSTERRSKSCASFNALNRKRNCRLPNIYDPGYHPPGYTQCDIREWKNEIKKIVPERPVLFLPAKPVLRPMSELMPPETERPRDTSVMFRTTVDPMYGRHQEYVVDPEWFSEKITPESVQKRAHCVYTWNF